jgi:hypothetical protein
LIGKVNDIEQTKESRAPQYQESGQGGEAKTHSGTSTQADADRPGQTRRQGSKKEKALATVIEIETRGLMSGDLSDNR